MFFKNLLVWTCLLIGIGNAIYQDAYAAAPTGKKAPSAVAPTPPPKVPPGTAIVMPGSGSFNVDDLLPQEYDYPEVGSYIGQGWNTYLGQPTSTKCVTGIAVPLAINSNSVRFSDIMDREELMSSMRISAKASFGGSIASGRADFSRTATVDRSKRNILATVDLLQDGEMLKGVAANKDGIEGVELTPAALALLSGSDTAAALKRFSRACGDTYVTAIHNGSKLNAMFSISHSAESLKTSYELNAKGSYGLYSGSLKAAIESASSNASDRVSFEQIHWGGPAGVAFTAVEMLKRIDTFATSTGQAKPFRLYAKSYRHVANWPAAHAYVALTSTDVSRMAGQRWRFQELGDLYAEAATAPNHFYFPYGEGTDIRALAVNAAKRADILQAASLCIQNIAMFCALESTCDLKVIFKAETLPNTCPGMVDANDPTFALRVADLVIGPTETDSLLPTFKVAVNTAHLKATLKPVVPEQSKLSNQALPRGTPAGTTSDQDATDFVRSELPFGAKSLPADIYYQYLAQAPLRRVWTPTARDPLDETLRFELFLAAEGMDATGLDYTSLSLEPPAPRAEPDRASIAFSAWIVRTKLLPLSRALCVDPSHPMCRTTTQLFVAAGSKVTLGKSRNFLPVSKIPDPVEPPRAAEVKPKPPRPKCPSDAMQTFQCPRI